MTYYAYTRYEIFTLNGGAVEVITETNDNLDYGYPTEPARWMESYPSLESALKVTGKSRQGIGHRVFVSVDGEAI